MAKNWEYTPKSDEQLHTWFNKHKSDMIRRGPFGFTDADDLKAWYKQNLMGKPCAYCTLTESESQEVFDRKILTTKKERGRVMEIDRKDPNKKYSKDNCIQCCYFCNNDKGDVFNFDQYKEFIKGAKRAEYIRRLLNDYNIGLRQSINLRQSITKSVIEPTK